MAQVVLQNQPANESVSEQYFRELIATNNTFDRQLATANPDIKFKHYLRSISAPISFQDASTDFNPPNTGVTIDARVLEVYPYAMQRKLTYENLREIMLWAKLPAGTLNDYLGTTDLNNAILAYYSEQISAANNSLYWLGMNAVSAYTSVSSTIKNAYLGLLPRLIAESTTKKVSAPKVLDISGISQAADAVITHGSGENDALEIGDVVTFSSDVSGMTQIRGLSATVIAKPSATTTTVDLDTSGFSAYSGSAGTVTCINKTNVTDVMAQVFRKIPEAIKNTRMVKFYASGNIVDAYMEAQALAGGNGVNMRYFLGEKDLDFFNVSIERMPDWLPNCILAALPSNLHIGYDLLDDENNMNVIWTYPTIGEKAYRMDVVMKTGEQITNPAESVIVTPAIHA